MGLRARPLRAEVRSIAARRRERSSRGRADYRQARCVGSPNGFSRAASVHEAVRLLATGVPPSRAGAQ
eukprot:1303182-Alexandrium_andersonii.AAC.1